MKLLVTPSDMMHMLVWGIVNYGMINELKSWELYNSLIFWGILILLNIILFVILIIKMNNQYMEEIGKWKMER